MKILILIMFLSSAVQQDTLRPTQRSHQTDSSKEQLTEKDYYKLLYESENQANQNLISITQWTIGISLTIVLALIFSQAFFNIRLNKKEIDYIKKDIDEKLLKGKTEISEDMDAKLQESIKESKESIKDRLNSESKVMDLELNMLKKDIKRDIKSIEADVEKHTGELWLLKGVESNALSSFIKTVNLQFDLKRETKYVLDDIIELLQKLEEIHESDYTELEKLVEVLKEKKKDYVDKIEPLFKDKPVYKLQQSLRDILGMPNSLYGGLPTKVIVKNKRK